MLPSSTPSPRRRDTIDTPHSGTPLRKCSVLLRFSPTRSSHPETRSRLNFTTGTLCRQSTNLRIYTAWSKSGLMVVARLIEWRIGGMESCLRERSVRYVQSHDKRIKNQKILTTSGCLCRADSILACQRRDANDEETPGCCISGVLQCSLVAAPYCGMFWSCSHDPQATQILLTQIYVRLSERYSQ